MENIETFSAAYREKLDEAELAKSVPDNLCLEVHLKCLVDMFCYLGGWS